MGSVETSRNLQVADVVCERIERLIVDGVLKTGQLLPSERRLTEKLGVSRTALREGLKLLRARGIIKTEQGKGSFVADLLGHGAVSPLMHLFSSQPRTLYDLFEVRSLLEGESARLAALRGTEADFVLITRSYQALLDAHSRSLEASEHARLRLYNAVFGRMPEQARKAAIAHIQNICDNLKEIESEEQRLVRATLRLEGWA